MIFAPRINPLSLIMSNTPTSELKSILIFYVYADDMSII